MTLEGPAIASGQAPASEVTGRIENTQKLFKRTTQRIGGSKYQDSGRTRQGPYETYISTSPGSFVITFQLGGPDNQHDMFVAPAAIVRSVVECLRYVEQNDLVSLEREIADPAYRRNFLGLALPLGPDGKRVRSVGITARLGGSEMNFVFRRPREELAAAVAPHVEVLPGPPQEIRVEELVVHVRGRLRFADDTPKHSASPTIKIVPETGNESIVQVPEGMMADIVQPFWGQEVVIEGSRGPRGIILLKSIIPADDEPAEEALTRTE